MKATCPNKKGVLYKELMSLNGNDEGLSTYQHNIITDLMDQGLITETRYKTPKGNFVYKIPKLMTEASIAKNLRSSSAYQIDLGKKQRLDKYISDNQINFIKTEITNSGNAIYVNLSKVNNITFEKPKNNPGPGIQGNLFEKINIVVENIKNAIKSNLPVEIFNAVEVLDKVPLNILGRDDLFLSMKDTLEEKGITDPFLINWLGINLSSNLSRKQAINSITTKEQIEKMANSSYNKLLKLDDPILKNKDIKESFDKWVKALENYPIVFKDLMLKHAIKHLRNPERRSKFVLQLSSVALQQTYGIAVNKPHELNRIGKLYDSEVLKTVSDAVGHEPSASGKGYWVHIPRTEKSLSDEDFVRFSELINMFKNPITISKTFGYKNTRYFVEDGKIKKLSSGLTLSTSEIDNIIKDIEKELEKRDNNAQFKVNVELLKKLSPSSWCTASGMASHYVENYDNYLLIVDGVTVAGIEAYPAPAIEDRETLLRKLNKIELNIQNGVAGPDEYNRRDEIEKLLSGEIPEIKVKEITSRGNNGVASIDHLDDTIAFFKKHNLDLDNNTIKRAISFRNEGKSDDVVFRDEDQMGAWHQMMDEEWERERWAIDEHNGEHEYDPPEYDYQNNEDNETDRAIVASMTTVEEVKASLTLVVENFDVLSQNLRNNEEIAREAVDYSGYNIVHINENLPFYIELVKIAVTNKPDVFQYLPPNVKEIRPDLKKIYDDNIEAERIRIANLTPEQLRAENRQADGTLNDDLPFSKTNSNLIEGYYDAKNDKVVVVASNVSEEDAPKVAIHEVAHRGMLRMAKDLGGEKELFNALKSAEKQLMEKLPELLKRTGHKSLESLMLDYGFDKNSQEGKFKLLQELAARWAETLIGKPKPTWWKKLLQNIKNWIKQFTGQVLTEKQVDELVGGFVRYGTEQLGKSKTNNEIQFSKKEDEETINVQTSNFKALEKGTKSISVRTTGKHNYKKGQILTVKVNGKETETKVRISSIKTVEDFTKLSKLEKDEFARSIGSYIDFEDFLKSDDYISSEKSEVFTDMIDFINGKISGDIIRYSVTQKSIVDQESPYKKQQIYLTRRIKELEKEREGMNQNTTAYDDKVEEIKRKRSKLILLGTSESDYDIYKELGQEYLDEVQDALDSFDDKEPTTEELTYLKEILDIWSDFKGLEKQGKELFERYRVLLSEHTIKTLNQHSSKTITKDDVDANTKDIRSFTKGTGSLLDSPNIIAGTIGRIIRAAQNIINTKDKKLALEIQEEVNLLYEYAKKNGAKLNDIYNLFIQDYKGTTKLTTEYFDNKKPNPNYKTIQDSPELSRFYDFYQTKMMEFEKSTDNTFGKYFIPNIAKSKLLDGLNPIKTRKVGFSFDQENVSDILETKYNNYLPASEKETNLGEILLKYGMYANNYEKMSSILPEVRLLQEQLTYKINSKGEIIERRFINASDPATSVLGKDSNIWQQVNQFIDMQVKGNMKNTKQGKYRILTTKYDKDGNPTEEKYIDVVSVFDTLLKYNSLLRIGLSPITSLSNVIFGDFSNLFEAIGGQFFNIRQLTSASNIFIKQNLDKQSLLNELLLELNPLQELDSYEYMEQVKLTGKTVKMSKEKAQEYIYSMQKSGEKWLQSRTMLAIMIHDGYMTPSGKLTEDGEKMMKSESLKNALTDKIQRLNQVIHGRYTTKEAAIWQQHIGYRLISQFRKWIPTGIENRFGGYRFDERLQTEVEGRYITLKNLVINLQDTLARVKEGKLTELEKYNIRKTIAEVVVLLATIILFAGLKGGDDDKKRLKNPWVKTSLTLLNRAAGDIGYFFNPKSGIDLLRNAVPLAKTLEGLLKVVEYLPYSMYLGDYEIKQGSFKGDNKFYSQVQKQIPVIKSVKDIMRLASKSSLEELR
jgi:hypothetical protein